MKFILACLLLFLVACESEDVTLAFSTSQEDLTYETTATLNAVSLASDSTKPDNMRTELYLRSKYALISAFDDGSARYEVRLDSVSYSSDKRSVEELGYMERYIRTQSFQYKIAADGEILAFPSMDDFIPVRGLQDLNIAKLFIKLQPVLPSKPVSVGESWERQHAITEGNTQTVVYKNFELSDVFYRDGDRIAAIKMRLRYKQNEEDAAFKMESDDFLVGDGTIEFNITDGAVENVSLEVSGKLKVSDKSEAVKLPDLNVRQTLKMHRIAGE